MSSPDDFHTFTVNTRIKLSGLWASLLFIFVYVDLFALFRPDFRAEVEAEEIAGFPINETFLVLGTIYILIPSLMVFLCLVLKPRVARIANIVLPILYAATIVAGVWGEWIYYIFASVVEIVILGVIARYAWNWPRGTTHVVSPLGDAPTLSA